MRKIKEATYNQTDAGLSDFIVKDDDSYNMHETRTPSYSRYPRSSRLRRNESQPTERSSSACNTDDGPSLDEDLPSIQSESTGIMELSDKNLGCAIRHLPSDVKCKF
jgi:hypothetical protein